MVSLQLPQRKELCRAVESRKEQKETGGGEDRVNVGGERVAEFINGINDIEQSYFPNERLHVSRSG
jgi:hypothetical protein